MDPLSTIASIVGVSQAGASLSKNIYKLISTARGAPKEIADIARGISEMSVILSEIRRILRTRKNFFHDNLWKSIRSATTRIHNIQKKIGRMINFDVEGGVGRIKWIFTRRPEVMELLRQIESHKTAINTFLQLMNLAATLQVNSASNLASSENNTDRALRFQQAENVVEASYHSLRQLVLAERATSEAGGNASESNIVTGKEEIHTSQLALWKDHEERTSTWLCRILFSAHAGSFTDACGDLDIDAVEDSSTTSADGTRNTDILSFQGTQEPFEPRKVVEDLLHEWADLSDDEIRYVVGKTALTAEFPGPKAKSKTRTDQDSQQQGETQNKNSSVGQHTARSINTSSGAEKSSLDGEGNETGIHEESLSKSPAITSVIELKDANGRNLVVPYELAKSWNAMEKFVKQAFQHIGAAREQVEGGQYDLLDSCNRIILPQVWELMVKPGDKVNIVLWPKKLPKKKQRQDSGFSESPSSPTITRRRRHSERSDTTHRHRT